MNSIAAAAVIVVCAIGGTVAARRGQALALGPALRASVAGLAIFVLVSLLLRVR